MNNQPQAKNYPEGVLLLFEGSRKAIPFNILLSFLLSLDLIYNHTPLTLVLSWFSSIVLISIYRWLFCKRVLQKELIKKCDPQPILFKFFLLTLLMGISWGVCYPLALPYANLLQEFIIILVFGGMSCGSIASLSVYLPAYYAYIFPMFIPVIVYNFYSLNPDRMILAMMFSLFILMLAISSKINKNLLNRTFKLSQEREALINKLQVISVTDPLTSLYNRRHFEEILREEFNRARRNQHSLTLISMDIDNFKLVNDSFGHPYGDQLLVHLAHLLKKQLRRSSDRIFRLGGDEFAIIVTNVPLDKVLLLCETFSSQFAVDKFPNTYPSAQEQTVLQQVALSMGLIFVHPNATLRIDNAISEVDHVLYEAKNKGKNTIVVKEITAE